MAACSPFWARARADLVFVTEDQLLWLTGNRSKVAAAVPFQAALRPLGTSDQGAVVLPRGQPLPVH